MGKKLGTDVGGTFTDFVVLDDKTGEIKVEKKLTTPDNPAKANMEGVDALIKKQGLNMDELDLFVHGTTLVANAIIERKGVKTGLITTDGYRDVLEIRNEGRYSLYDLFLELPTPIVPRYLRKTLNERIDSSGRVILPLDEEEVLEILSFFKDQGVESVGVSLFNAYANHKHEKIISQIMEKHYPEMFYTLSSEIAPEIREYERTSTTVANAFVQPMVKNYVNILSKEMQAKGLQSEPYIMLSSGGMTTIEGAGKYPVTIVESGPAAGAISAAYHGRNTGIENLISFDMGGTTAKICLIENGQPHFSYDFEVARLKRFEKGSGLPLKIPVIDMIEIGAGGGSIAQIDSMGLLKVGPESAGADPGPVCYGRGNERPTVTDADVIMGCINPDYFLGGDMSLDLDGAFNAVKKDLAEPGGIEALEAAVGVHNVVNNNMSNAAKNHTADLGKDPRQFALIAFGGAGPVHAYGIAKLLNIKQVVYPPAAGVASALGLLVAPLRVDAVRSLIQKLNDIAWKDIIPILKEMEEESLDMLNRAGVPNDEAIINYVAEMRYAGQGHEIVVPISREMIMEKDSDALQEAFNNTYTEKFGRCLEGMTVEVLTWRITAYGQKREVKLSHKPASKDADIKDALKGKREVYFPEEKQMVECMVYDRYLLPPGGEFKGPAIIEERESTIVIGSDTRVHITEDFYVIADIVGN